MVFGAIWFMADVTTDLGSSFFLGGLAGVLDIVVAIIAIVQSVKSDVD